MKRTIVLLSLVILTGWAWGKDKKLVPVKVEVVSSEGMQGSVQGGGVVGAAVGRRVVTDAWTMKVIVNGEHAILKCYENHEACHFYAAGTYDGELKTHKGQDYGSDAPDDPDLWIHYVRPLDHANIREHWKVSGSW
ncbi:MAG: hypothetical protein WA252_20475 [Candidatus Sulfotelmatobacter sp.]